jgi:hypothetical protein
MEMKLVLYGRQADFGGDLVKIKPYTEAKGIL